MSIRASFDSAIDDLRQTRQRLAQLAAAGVRDPEYDAILSALARSVHQRAAFDQQQIFPLLAARSLENGGQVDLQFLGARMAVRRAELLGQPLPEG